MSPGANPCRPPKRLLVVEGRSELHTVLGVLKLQSELGQLKVEIKGGYEAVLRSIGPEIKVRDRMCVGFVVDANNDFDSRWREIKSNLAQIGVAVPTDPDPDGTIVHPRGRPRVGVWIMPDNSSPGELEDLLIKSIPDKDQILPRAKDYVDGIDGCDRKFDSDAITKAHFLSWMAVRERPGYISNAIAESDLDISLDPFRQFVRWMHSLQVS